MNERSIFMAALERHTPDQRSSYVEEVCAGDTALRQRVEALLRSHEQAGDFLGKPAPERLADELADSQKVGETQAEVPPVEPEREALRFLAPAGKPGVLGRLGHYEVLDVIGRGGMGIVLRAFDETLHRIVAIKVMAAQLASSGTARKRFTREAQAAAAVSHDHIVTIHAVEGGPTPYMVMQYVHGVSLQQRLDREGPLPLPEILRIGMQTASGLAAAHAQGLIHRDIKPANILLENGVQRVRITDFGMARAAADANLTHSGVVTGTPQYMAPEQARAATVDARTDLFSLGSVLYAMCTGRPPFRASGSMAVLKRVCEETPRPIRESNPEIPDWLVAIIDKLHAKDPAQRFQSAAELADLLSGHLAQLQQPSVLPLPPEARPAERPTKRRRRRWAIAGAVCALLLLGGLSVTEATGLTNLRATVIRIATPDGTLVVETDDPGVKVTVEGDGGLTINVAGLEEIRLRPGSYHLRADKDGKPVPLERELVSIAKGGREVVKVKLEPAPATPPVRAKVETGPFVLLAAGKERRFETLAEAVLGARDGDTIEVRGNGPFAIKPIKIQAAVTIRAGDGFRPVIKADPSDQGRYLLQISAPLVLEGLDLQWLDATAFDPTERNYCHLVVTSGPSLALHVANCRFLASRREGPPTGISCIGAWDASLCLLRNCQFLVGGRDTGFGNVLGFRGTPHGQLMVENCLNVGGLAYVELTHAEPMKMVLKRNTFLGTSSPVASFVLGKKIEPPPLGENDPRPIQMETSANILEGHVQFVQYGDLLAKDEALNTQQAEQFLTKLFGWRENRNLYLLPEDGDLLRLFVVTPPGQYNLLAPVAPTRTLADWKSFWGMAELDSERGQPKFQGVDLVAKARQTPEQLLPGDFRLRADSVGYQAGKDKKDLGADVDLVGPGPAYERWKKTPDYQKWLRDTKQFDAEALKPEPRAFALLGGKGVEVARFDTLAEAVRAVQNGDTIEVRGNGPFISDPIEIALPLTIRAGEGFRPVIKLSPEGRQRELLLLSTNALLVLEGLELHQAPSTDPGRGNRRAVIRSKQQAPLRAANCRFRAPIWANQSPVCVFRNCEFLTEQGAFAVRPGPGTRFIIENCLYRTNEGAMFFNPDVAGLQDVSVQIKRSTFANSYVSLWLAFRSSLPVPSDQPQAVKPIRLEVSGSIFDTPRILGFDQTREFLDNSAAPQPADAAAALLRFLEWRGERNLFAVGSTCVRWHADAKEQPPRGPASLEEWKRFWGSTEADSLEGQLRFQGGNLRSRPDTALDQLTPAHFRLRSDSPGYRAGKDGKDLGADVDLVGPGPPYNRWKKTPEYQQWLKDIAQSADLSP